MTRFNRKPRQTQGHDAVNMAVRAVIEQLESRMLLAVNVNNPAWVEVGPGPIINSDFVDVPGDDTGAGAVEAIATPPHNAGIVFVGTVNGGVWRTENGTLASPTWTPRSNGMGSLSIGALALGHFDAAGTTKITKALASNAIPINEFVVYAGVGRVSSSLRDGGPRIGLFQSTNGGNSWQRIGGNTFNGLDIRSIVPGSDDSDLILVAAQAPPHASRNTRQRAGVYRSGDGGMTFEQVLQENVSHLVDDPGNADRFYAAVPGKGVFRSTSRGVTGTWMSVSNGLDALRSDTVDNDRDGNTNNAAEGIASTYRIELAVHHSVGSGGTVNNVLYAALISRPENDRLMGIFRSTDQGATWKSLTNVPDVNNSQQGDVHFSMVADRANPNVLYVAGDFGPNRLQRGVVGADGATTAWASIVDGGANNTTPHPDSREMVINAVGDIVQGDDGGVYRLINPSNDPTFGIPREWRSMLGNLRPTEFNSVARDSVNGTLIGGTQDNGTPEQQTPGSFTWTQVVSGDGGFVQTDNSGGTVSLHYSSADELAGFNYRTVSPTAATTVTNIALVVKNSGGRTLTGPGVLRGESSRVFDNSLQFYVPYVLNAAEPNRMLIGTEYVYESDDRGATLTVLTGLNRRYVNSGGDNDQDGNADPDPDEVYPDHSIGRVTALAYGGFSGATKHADVAYVAAGRKLYVREAGKGFGGTFSANFSERPAYRSRGVQGGLIEDIALDPQDWRTGYVASSKGRVFRFVNTGSAAGDWTHISRKLPTSDVRTVEVIRAGAAPEGVIVLVGGKGGVFACLNPSAGRNAAWVQVGRGLPRAVVTDLRYDNTNGSDVLFVGTLGRGAWQIPSFVTAFLPAAAAQGAGFAAAAIIQPGLLEITGDELANKNDTFRLVRNADDPQMLDVFVNNTTETPDLSVEMAAVSKIVVRGLDGDDTLTIDHANGLVSPSEGIDFDDSGPGTDVRQDLNLTAIPSDAVTSIRNGLQSLANWAGQLAAFGEAAQALPAVGMSLGQMFSIGDGSAPIKGVLQQGVVDRVLSYFSTDLSPTIQELTEQLKLLSDTLGDVALSVDGDFVSGGLYTGAGGQQEIRFDLSMSLAAFQEDLALDFGAEADALGLAFDAAAKLNLSAGLDMAFSFGFDLTPGLPLEDAFFIRVENLALTGQISAGASADKAPNVDQSDPSATSTDAKLGFGVKVGFLQAQVNQGSLSLNAQLSVELNNPDGDAAGNITLSELTGTSIGELVELTPEGSLKARLPLEVSLGGLDLTEPVIHVVSEDLFGAAPSITTENFDDLLNFNNISAQGMLNLFQQLGDWLYNYRTSSVFAASIPFTDTTLGDVLDFQRALTSKLTNLLSGTDGRPNFESAQALADKLVVLLGLDPSIVDARYDPATQELTYHIGVSDVVASAAANLGLGGFDLGSIAGVSVTSGTLQLDATVSANLIVGVVLAPRSSVLAGSTDAPANGQLSGSSSFTLQIDDEAPVPVTVAADATNTSIDDLVMDLNTALDVAGLGGVVLAGRDGNRITLATQGVNAGRRIVLSALAGEPILTQLGFANGQSAQDNLTDRFFIENASLGGSLSFTAEDVDIAARLGFIGIGIDGGSGQAVASATLNLTNPNVSGGASASVVAQDTMPAPRPRRISFPELFGALITDPASLVKSPSVFSQARDSLVNVSRREFNQDEAVIAVDPTDPNRVFAASNSDNRVGAGIQPGLFAAYSTDGGANWTRSLIGTVLDDLPEACCDPSVVFDQFGNLFFSYINASKNAIIVLLSTNGGQTFTELTRFTEGVGVDQPTLATGPGEQPGTQSLWIAYRGPAPALMVRAAGARISGKGADNIGSFTTPQDLPGSSAGNFADPAIGPKGQVMVAWTVSSAAESDGEVRINVDPDGLGPMPFGTDKLVTKTNVGVADAIPAQPNRKPEAAPDVAYDLSGGLHRGRVYLVFVSEEPDESNNTDIRLMYSDDNGGKWTALPKPVNDDGGVNSQFLPRLAVDPKTGYVGVAWHDARNDRADGSAGDVDTTGTANDQAQFFAAVSVDGGASFLSNIALSPNPPSTGTSNQGGITLVTGFTDRDYGDYAGLDFVGGKLHAVWADNSNSTADNPDGTSHFDVYTARVSITATDEMAPASLAPVQQAALEDLPFAFTGSVRFDLPVTLTAGFITLPSNAAVTIDWPDITQPFDPAAHIRFTGLEELLDFEGLSFDQILAGLRALIGYLRTLESFSFLNTRLPLLNRSVNDLLGYADALAAKVDELQANPQQSLQEVETFIRDELGLPISLSIDTPPSSSTEPKALRMELDAGASYNGDPIPLNFDIASLAGSLGFLGSLVGGEAAATINTVAAGAMMHLHLGLSLDDFTPFLYDSTNLSLTAEASASIARFAATLGGVLGIFVKDGHFTLDRDGNPATAGPAEFLVSLDPVSNDRYSFTDPTLSDHINVSLDAGLVADLPIFFPDDATPIGGQPLGTDADADGIEDHVLHAEISHSGDFAGNFDTVSIVPPNVPDLADLIGDLNLSADLTGLINGLYVLLGYLQTAMESQFLSKNLPLVGDNLHDAAGFIADLRSGIQTLRDLPSRTTTAVRAELYNVLNGLSLVGELDGVAGISPDDILLIANGTENVEFRFRIVKEVNLAPAFNIGLPALGLNLSGAVDAQLDFDMTIGAGISRADGVYFDTAAGGAGPEMSVGLNVTVPNLTFAGDFGFLRVRVTDEDAGGSDGDARGPSQFTGAFAVNLLDPLGSNNRLTAADIDDPGVEFQEVVDARLTASADVNLDFVVDFGDTTRFPSFLTEFNLDWGFSNASTNTADTDFGSAPLVSFSDVRLNLGTFLSGFAGPVVGRIQEVLDPLRPVVDFLDKEIDALAGIGSLRDFFDDPPNGNNDNKVQVREVISRIAVGQTALKFVDAARFILDLNVPAGGAALVLRFGDFNLNSVDLRQRTSLEGVEPPTSGARTDITQQIDALSDAAVKGFLNDLQSDQLGGTSDAGDRGKPQFPIFQSPATAFKLLLGQDVDLFLWDMPKFGFDLSISRDFPILGPLEVTVSGAVGAQVDLGFGYDTQGLRKFIGQPEGSRDVDDLLDGFFFIDHLSGTTDLPELLATGRIGIGVGVDVVVAEGKLEGALEGSLSFDLRDSDGDGKVRFADLSAGFSQGPLRIFDITGEFFIVLSGSLKVGVCPLCKEWKKDFAKVQLLEFNLSGGEATGGGEDFGSVEDGVLTLRTVDGVDDDILVSHISGSAGDEAVQVRINGTGGPTFNFSGVRKIVGPPSTGDDTIIIQQAVLAEVELSGGDGNDFLAAGGGVATLIGGAGEDVLAGGTMADQLSGEAGGDLLVGGGGNDTLSGGADDDFLAGDIGNDDLYGDDGDDTLVGNAGNDTLSGGTGADSLSGGDDDDSLNGEEGDDTLLGQAGHDYATGGSGNDLLDGGEGNDTMQGDSGDDTLLGREGEDDLAGHGGLRIIARLPYFFFQPAATDNDRLVGGGGADVLSDLSGNNILVGDYDNTPLPSNPASAYDPRPGALADQHEAADQITGGSGNDSIWGDNKGPAGDVDGPAPDASLDTGDSIAAAGGDDLVFASAGPDSVDAGTGNDTVYGGTGDDTVAGSSGADLIEGNDGDDSLAGDDDSDTISGNAGNDSIEGGSGNDSLLGGTGDDTIRGQEGDDSIAGQQGNDSLFGDAGDDILLGDTGTINRDTRAASTTDLAGFGADTVAGGTGRDSILGGGAGDRLDGGAEADVVLGDLGSITGNSIASTPSGTSGADRATGGDGDDILVGGDVGDAVDGGRGRDLIFGDNVLLTLHASSADAIAPRFRVLSGSTIYDAQGLAQITAQQQLPPGGLPPWADWTITLDQTTGDFGDDYLAGGAGDDEIFAQLGNDTVQGDGSIDLTVIAARQPDGTLAISGSVEDYAGPGADGDDYIEGNAGDDLIFGNLGQDDLIGGSSRLFSFTDPALRPDGQDLIFGGAGVQLARNHPGDTSANGNARDADYILGDNGSIYRLVSVTGGTAAYRTFNYDNAPGSTLRLIPRAIELLDYTRGGSMADIGGADLIHGEGGDDVIHGQTGHDVLYGDAQDDDLYGGTGHDRIYGGSGIDGILGDDGLLLTSRNGLIEPLHGLIAPNAQTTISTPGPFIGAVIYITGHLLKTASLAAYDSGGNDLIYGGLNDDFIHGGFGDDAISGAEAQAPWYNDRPVDSGFYDAGLYPVTDPLNPLGYDSTTRKLAAYDASNPWARITGFFLNFNATDTIPTGEPSATVSDGRDHIFGDLGNDWLVGGTGHDRLFGGFGDDLLQADDNLDNGTAPGLNNRPDAVPFNDGDFAFGGGGLDVLIANTGADRLFDWLGEFNSYVVPFAAFGNPTVIRAPSPQISQFLLSLGQEGGSDRARIEPDGELGLVMPSDPQWPDQHGAPRDPQQGNIVGVPRDTMGEPENDSLSAQVQHVVVNEAVVAPDPINPAQNALFIGGTTGADTISVRKAKNGVVRVIINGVLKGQFTLAPRTGPAIGRIYIYGYDGNDNISIGPDAGAIPAIIYGDMGNDTLRGGAGPNLIDGGEGADQLIGNVLRDVLIGGRGQDNLSGDLGEDILFGGPYRFSEDSDALSAVLGKWLDTQLGFNRRVSDLSAGIGPFNYYVLDAATAPDDGAIDTLLGGKEPTWFFAGNDKTDYKKGDVLNSAQTAMVSPANDAFTAALPLSGTPVTVSQSNRNATKQAGEAKHGGRTGSASVWWTWTAPRSGLVVIDTALSNFDTLLGVYVGKRLANLRPIAANDNARPEVGTSRVRFQAVAGQTYRIAVAARTKESGWIHLRIRQAASKARA